MSHNLTQPDSYIPPELIGLTRSVTPGEFEKLCRKYDELRLELTSTGELVIMPPVSTKTGMRNFNLNRQLGNWAIKDGTGVCFDSSTLFALPNNAIRSPDGSWVRREKWDSLSEQQQERIAPICPDFVIELRSPSDRLPPLLNKMVEYLENGASLGWLIDPFKRRLYVYKPDHELEILEKPETISGEPLLPGFTLHLTELWRQDYKMEG